MTGAPLRRTYVCASDEDQSAYPVARIPLTSPLSLPTWRSKTCRYPALTDIAHLRVSSGRAAITLALQQAGVTSGDEVLVPAYHCESMVAPIELLGATPVFYRVKPNTAVDLPDISTKISGGTKAILATHYFGFAQAFDDLRSVCDEHDLTLIEDCAHAFFGRLNNNAVGSIGDFAIGSAMKFFPLFDGGILASARHDLGTLTLFQPSATLELKGLINIVEYGVRYGRAGPMNGPTRAILAAKDRLWKALKTRSSKLSDKSFAPSSSEGGYSLEPQWISARMSRISNFILNHSNADRICDGRRDNYMRIVRDLAGCPGIQPLFEDLPDDTVPLVVPMVVDDPMIIFPRLKHLGVPIWRFGEYLHPDINESVCASSVFLSRHVFQFPCHASLSEDELGWMIRSIREQLVQLQEKQL